MSNYRIRPKEKYIQEVSWDNLYFFTQKWKENIEFYKIDVKFLIDLLKIYFSKLLVYENLNELRKIQIDFINLYNECEATLKHIQLHLSHLSNLIEDLYIYDAYVFRNEQEQLEDKIAVLINNIKRIRKDTFSLIKDVLKNEKPKIFWRYN